MSLDVIDVHRLRALTCNPQVYHRFPQITGRLATLASSLAAKERTLSLPVITRVIEYLEDLLEREAQGQIAISSKYHGRIDWLFVIWLIMASRIATQQRRRHDQ